MDPREVIKNNGYIGPASFSVGTPYVNLAPTNWGVPAGPLLLVSLDPQVDVGKTLFHTSSDSVDFVKRRIRRKVMSELANEFATSNDDLLRELAR